MKFTSPLLLVIVLATSTASTALAAPITLQQPTATFSQVQTSLHIDTTIDGITGPAGTLNGWAISPKTTSQTAAYETQSDVVGGTGGSAFTFTLIFNFQSGYDLGKFRLSVTTANRNDFADGKSGADNPNPDPGNVGDPSIWTQLTPLTANATNGVTLAIQGDNTVLVTSASNLSTFTVTADTPINNISGIRLEALTDPSLPAGGPGMFGNNNFVLTEFQVDAVNIVPEPACLATLLLGAFPLLLRRRR